MARLVIAHRFEELQIAETPLRRRPAFLEHLTHGLAQFTKLIRMRTDDVMRHDRGGSLAKGTGLHLMREIADHIAIHLEIDGDGRATQARMRGCRGVRCFKSAQAWDGSGKS